MKSYLEFSDELKNSHKFYEVTIQGNQVTFRFGRIADDGQTKTEIYETHEQAQVHVERKIQEKLKKGYQFAVIGDSEKKSIPKKPRIPFEEQLQNLAGCGIKLRSEFLPEILFEDWTKEEFEKEPFELLLIALGDEKELSDGQWTFLSDNIWHFDAECIEGNGSYINIAERLRDLAGDDLPLQNIKDYVDIDEESAWLEFTLDSKDYHLNFEVSDDWADTEIFNVFAQLLQNRNPNKNFTYFNFNSQDGLIGCSTSEQLKTIKEITQMDVDWIDEPAK